MKTSEKIDEDARAGSKTLREAQELTKNCKIFANELN